MSHCVHWWTGQQPLPEKKRRNCSSIRRLLLFLLYITVVINHCSWPTASTLVRVGSALLCRTDSTEELLLLCSGLKLSVGRDQEYFLPIWHFAIRRYCFSKKIIWSVENFHHWLHVKSQELYIFDLPTILWGSNPKLWSLPRLCPICITYVHIIKLN